MANTAAEIIELARRAKAFIKAAGEGPVADELLVRAATAYNMMVRQGQIAESKHPDLDVPHAIATIAANYADYPASTKHRAALFATRLDDDDAQEAAPEEPSAQLDLLVPPVPMWLDYSEPPLGIHVRRQEYGGLTHPHTPPEALGWLWHDGERGDAKNGEAVSAAEGRPAAVAKAWAFYKLHNDPPGFNGSNAEWIEGTGWRPFTAADFAKQRADAWAFYDRRRTLAIRCARAQKPHEHWPRALSWTSDDCDQIEHWLERGGRTPAALTDRITDWRSPAALQAVEVEVRRQRDRG